MRWTTRIRTAFAAASAALLCGALPALCAPHAAAARPAATGRNAAERVALARARTALCQRVLPLPLTSELTVGTWVAQNIGREREFRRVIRALPPSRATRTYSDGTCAVDINLTPDLLAGHLCRFLPAPASGSSPALSADDVQRASRNWPTIWATGRTTPPGIPAASSPPGWEDLTPEGVDLTRRAAVSDAVYALLDEAGQLKLTPARRLREFLECDHEVFRAVVEAVARAATIAVEYAPHQIAVARARLEMPDLIGILAKAHQQHYRGQAFHAPDFHEMALTANRSEIRGTGLAMPPDRYRWRDPRTRSDLDAPPWSQATLAASGRYRPPADGLFPPGAQTALARADAIMQLRAKANALPVDENVTVGQLLVRRPQLEHDVALFLSGSRVVDSRTTRDGTCVVRVELPLRHLWTTLRRASRPATAARPTAETDRTNLPREVNP